MTSENKELSEIKKMLRAVINGQSALKSELIARIDKVEEKFGKDVQRLEEKVERNGERIDTLGKNLAYLEDDAPTLGDNSKLDIAWVGLYLNWRP